MLKPNAFLGAAGILLAVALLHTCATVPSSDQAVRYFVNAATGDDANDGRHETAQGSGTGPWKTIGKAAATVPNGSATVEVASGTYREAVMLHASGIDAERLLAFKAVGEVTIHGTVWIDGNFVSLDGFRVTYPDGPCDAPKKGASIAVFGRGVVVSYCTVEDSVDEGICLFKETADCIVRGNRIRRVYLNGMFVDGANNLVENNDIADIRDSFNGCQAWGYDANGIVWNGTGHVFRGNFIHDISWKRMVGKPHIDAFQTYDGTKDCIFAGNHVLLMEDTPYPEIAMHGFMLSGGVDNLVIRNNIMEVYSGINTAEPKGPVTTNIKIYHNVWRGDLRWSGGYYPGGIKLRRVAGAEVYNNITIDFSWAHIYVDPPASGVVIENNCMYNSDGSRPRAMGFSLGTTNTWNVNPEFVNEWTDFHLKPSSRCRDAGRDLAGIVVDDFAGNPRPQAKGYDIGCYEENP